MKEVSRYEKSSIYIRSGDARAYGDGSLVYEKAENKLAIEHDGKTSEVSWTIQHFGGGVGMSIGLVDMT